MRIYAILLVIGISVVISMAKETATNEASTEDIVDKKDPVQAKQEQFDESEEEPSEVRSADDEDEDEDPAEERDEGAATKKSADPVPAAWRRIWRRRRRCNARRRYHISHRRRYVARRRNTYCRVIYRNPISYYYRRRG